MPIYEYRCRDCEEEFEILQKISARQLRKCRSCGGRLEKLLSQTSFVLRGGGWYSDGYAGESKKKKKGKASGESGGSDASSGSSKKDAAPAKKGAAAPSAPATGGTKD